MTRGRTTAQVAADTAPHAGLAVLIEALFDSGALRLCMGPRSVTVGSDVYQATAGLLEVKEHQETADGAEGLQFVMSGLDEAVFELMLSEPYNNRVLRMLEMRYDAEDQEVGAATVEYIGLIKAMVSQRDDAAGTHTITVQTESFESDGRRARPVRWSDAEQRRRFPADRGAECATAMTEVVLARKPKA